MKAYKLEILIVDADDIGGKEIAAIIESQKYPNYCILPMVMKIQEADIGEWHDDHPLNKLDKMDSEFRRIFEQDDE